MIERAKNTDNTNKTESINKQFTTNPIFSGNSVYTSDSLSKKVEILSKSSNPEAKYKEISEIVDQINSLPEQEIRSLMSDNHEMIRGIAARAYVDTNSVSLVDSLKLFLSSDNECLRDSAVIALCYMNTPKVLGLLEYATGDTSYLIRLRALTGIADIAAEYSSKSAIEILQRFLNDENKEIREFVSDELSIIF